MKYTFDKKLNFVIKMWLIVILFVTPYQVEIMNHIGAWSAKLSIIIQLLDEITIIIFSPLAIRELYKEKNQNQLLFFILFPLVMFSIIGLLSGMINDNSAYQTAYGVFYYIKYFILIFIYAAFFRTFADFEKIFRFLLIFAVIVGFLAFIQESWFLLYRNFIERDPANKIINSIHSVILKITYDEVLYNPFNWRLGVSRVSSLMSHYNLLGFYSLMILTIYLYTAKRVNPFFFLSLLAGIYFSVSRVAFIGFSMLGILQIIKGRKWLIPFIVIPICVMFYSFSASSEFDLKDQQMMSTLVLENKQTIESSKTYRKYARDKATEIWKNYPYLGIGPGMFGGPISRKMNSPVYEEYNFSSSLLNHYMDLDQFWPQALAETGIVGTAAFAYTYISLLLIFLLSGKWAIPNELKDFLSATGIITVFIFLNTFASSLNIVSILYPYCAFAGMGLGCISNIGAGVWNPKRKEKVKEVINLARK